MNLKFEPITLSVPEKLGHIVTDICMSTQSLYTKNGYQPPWLGYLAKTSDGKYVGTCAFKSPPTQGRVEIAYFTFPDSEGKGVATAMVQHLLSVAQAADSTLQIFAQTLPEKNSSNHILQKLGFEFIGDVEHPQDGSVWEWRKSHKT